MRGLRYLFVTSVTVALAGCSIHPLPEDVTRKTTYDIIEAVRCEAKQAVLVHAQEKVFDDAYIGYDFEFKITENNNASGATTFRYPFSTGTFSLSLDAGSNKSRDTKRTVRVFDSFADLKKADCTGDKLRKNLRYPIAGSVGLDEVVGTFARLEKLATLREVHKSGSDVFAFADTLTFTTTFSGGVRPNVTLSPIADRFRLVEAKADLNASRTDVHKVTVALAGPPPEKVVNMKARRAIGFANVPPTLIQDGSDPRTRVLLELDRQRQLERDDILRNLGLIP